MLDATGKKLLRLLQPGHPTDVRCASIRVLGELGLRNADVTRAIGAGLDDPDPAVRAQMIAAAGKLRIEQALPRLLERIADGGEESELAAHAAARLGPRATRALQELMTHVAPGLRRRIAGALAAAGAERVGSAAVDALLDSDPGVVDATARSLSAEIPSLSASHKKALADHLLGLLEQARREPLPVPSETAVIRLLAALGDERGAKVFWDRIQPAHPVEVRAAALQGLGKSIEAPPREHLKHLLSCAADRDFRVAAPALMLLKDMPVSDKHLSDWLTLLDAPDVAVRRAALDKLQDRDNAVVAEALVRQLHHPDRWLREQALGCLGRLSEGRKALALALLKAQTPDDAWALARSQERFVADYDARLRQQIFTEACAYLEAADRRADALLHLLRAADAHEVRDRLEERALALRKKKQYEKAQVYLRLLTRDPACGAGIRLEAAACALKLSPRDLAHDSREADPCVEQFVRLIHNHEAETLDFVTRAKWLDPEELFYLGFHFVEKERQEKKFGGAALNLVIKRSPRSKLAKDAKSKLLSAGLE